LLVLPKRQKVLVLLSRTKKRRSSRYYMGPTPNSRQQNWGERHRRTKFCELQSAHKQRRNHARTSALQLTMWRSFFAAAAGGTASGTAAAAEAEEDEQLRSGPVAMGRDPACSARPTATGGGPARVPGFGRQWSSTGKIFELVVRSKQPTVTVTTPGEFSQSGVWWWVLKGGR
jgi:hypothetical protein